MTIEKLELLILFDNEDYLASFSYFVQTSSYKEQLIIRTFSDREALNDWFGNGGRTNMLLLPLELSVSSEYMERVDIIIFISEQATIRTKGQFPVISAYQPISGLLDEAIRYFRERYGPSSRGQRSTMVTTICSAVGGAGKTTLALNVCRQLALLDNRVFYLNLEHNSSVPLIFDCGEEQSFGQLLYYIRIDEARLEAKMEQFRKTDSRLNVDYFPPPRFCKEMDEMTLADVKRLIRLLCDCGRYDHLIIDTDNLLNDRCMGALQESDKVWWLLTDHIHCLTKSRRMLDEWKLQEHEMSISERIEFLAGQWTGSSSTLMESRGFQVAASLPYVSKWKCVSDLNEMLSNNDYNRQVLELIVRQKNKTRERRDDAFV